MKKLISVFALFVLMGSLYSQEFFVEYDMAIKANDPEMQAQMDMIKGSTYQMHVKGNKSNIQMDMGGLMKTTYITDIDKDKGLILMDGMMGKQASTYSLKEEEADNEDLNFEIELLNETKDILGYTCKKAILYSDDDSEVEFVYWYAEDIKFNKGNLGDYIRKEVPGLPLEYTIQHPEFVMNFVATKFESKVKAPKTIFDTSIPKGYSEISFDTLKNMQGGL